MKSENMIVTATSLILLAAGAVAQTVVQGPLYNGSTGARYYVLEGGTYAQMRTAARAMGGDLATVENAAENAWIQGNLTAGGTRKLYLGLNDEAVEGTFAWSDGGSSAFRNWAPAEPGNSTTDDYAALFGNDGGRWYVRAGNMITHGLVKVTGDIRVPGEVATVNEAVGVALASGSPWIRLAEGTYTMTEMIDVPVGVTLRIRGESRGSSLLRMQRGANGFMVRGQLELQSLQYRGDGQGFPFTTPTAGVKRITIRNCDLSGGNWVTTMFDTNGETHLLVESSWISGTTRGVVLTHTNSTATFRSTLLYNNDRLIDVGPGDATFEHCTFLYCGSISVPIFDRDVDGTITVSRSIFDKRMSGASLATRPVSFSETCFGPDSGVASVSGTNFLADPMLDPGTHAPRRGSVCQDWVELEDFAGSMRDGSGGTRFRGAKIDLGANEGSEENPCSSDFNDDGFVDFFDYDAFVEAFENGC
jgi:hypothetical protein